jgi:hypothetical protein
MAEIRIPISVDLKDGLNKLKQVQDGVKNIGDKTKEVNSQKPLGSNIEPEPFQRLNQQFRAAQAELQRVIEKFGVTSVQAKAAAQKAAGIKDAIEDSKLVLDAFDPDAKFKGFANAVGGATGALTAITGVQALFGTKSKEVAEALAKVQGALAISQGLNQILASKDAFKALALQLGIVSVKKVEDTATTVANSAAQITNSAATNTSAVATEGMAVAQETAAVATTASSAALGVFKTALIATGIGVFAVGLGLLIANWGKISEAIGFTNKNLENYKDITAEAAKNSAEEVTKLRILYQVSQDQTESLKTRNKAVDELQKLYPAYFGNLSNEAILAGNAKTKYEELTQSIIAKARAEASVGKITELYSTDKYQKALSQVNTLNDTLERAKKTGISAADAISLNMGFASAFKPGTKEFEGAFDLFQKKLKERNSEAIKTVDDIDNQAKNIIKSFNAGGIVDAVIGGDKTGGKKATTQVETVKSVLEDLKKNLTGLDIKADVTGANVLEEKIKTIQDAIIKLRTNLKVKPGDNVLSELNDQLSILKFQRPVIPISFNRKQFYSEQKKLIEDANQVSDKAPTKLIIPVQLKQYQTDKAKEDKSNQDRLKAAEEFAKQINDIVSGSLADLATTFASGLVDIFSGGSFKDTLLSGLSSIGKALQEIGKQFIAAGVKVAIFKKLLFKNPILAIAAGVGLALIGATLEKSVQKKLDSGNGYARGGRVRGPGTSTSDSIPAMLSDGEYVIKASTVRKYGSSFFDNLNSGVVPEIPLKLAEGGLVSNDPSTISDSIGGAIEALQELANGLPSRALVNKLADSSEAFTESIDETAQSLEELSKSYSRALVNRAAAGGNKELEKQFLADTISESRALVNRAFPVLPSIKAANIPTITQDFNANNGFIAETRISGQDLKLVLNRADSRYKTSA